MLQEAEKPESSVEQPEIISFGLVKTYLISSIFTLIIIGYSIKNRGIGTHGLSTFTPSGLRCPATSPRIIEAETKTGRYRLINLEALNNIDSSSVSSPHQIPVYFRKQILNIVSHSEVLLTYTLPKK